MIKADRAVNRDNPRQDKAPRVRFGNDEPDEPRGRRMPRPLDAARLDELALAYVARFATSTGKLDDYLKRKLRERGWDGEGSGVEAARAVVARFVAAGYIDDASFARNRSDSLQRRGYGRRRIVEALGQAGIAGETARGALPGRAQARRAALALARKRGFGPFARGGGCAETGDPLAARALREKQVAAMLRAGHALDTVRELVDAASIAAAEAWVAEAEDEENEEGRA